MSMNELVKLKKPSLPVFWDYETSVKFVSETIFKWKNLTEDIAKELWIAREIIQRERGRGPLPEFRIKRSETWENYCEKIGTSKGVVNKWLKQWFEIVHVSQNSGENEWYTPPEIIESARAIMGKIDLDPATSESANEIIKAEQIFTEENDGLIQQWNGNVWMNPPYSQPLISEFSDKLISELPNINQACILVNNATETNWLQNMMQKCDVICFLKGRIKFIDMNGNPSGAPLQGQVILYFGENIIKFNNEFNKHGICMMKIS